MINIYKFVHVVTWGINKSEVRTSKNVRLYFAVDYGNKRKMWGTRPPNAERPTSLWALLPYAARHQMYTL
jgi:hypothetical protein